MKSLPTLKMKVNRISMGVFLAASLLMLIGFIFYSTAKNRFSVREVESDLRRSASQQVEQLIPSFLLPEQRDGVALLLEKFKKDDQLSSVNIILRDGFLPSGFLACKLDSHVTSICQNEEGTETAVITPITEGTRNFGWLFKARANSSAFASKDLFQILGLFIGMLALIFGFIHVLTTRILSRTLPKALDGLVAWIEADLADKSSTVPALPFRELEELKEKISEVLDRHSRERDQAFVGQLTSGIMHDIRTPLQSIVTAMHLAEKYPPEHSKYLSRLENLLSMCRINLPVIGKIIESTLDSSRHINVEKKSCDLMTTVRASVELNREFLNLRKAEVDLVGPEQLNLEHDPIQFGRVISNLIKNGVEAKGDTDQKPLIRIHVGKGVADRLSISVEDNGPGFSASPQKVFRAFRSSKVHGSGLGLHISQKIVEAHQGAIRAGSSADLGGAKIEIEIPVQKEIQP